MADGIHTYFEQAISALEKYTAEEPQSERREAAPGLIGSYRDALREPRIDDVTHWNERLAVLMEELEAVVAHGSMDATAGAEELKRVIHHLNNSIQGL